jgi:hypothetical protein
MFDARAIILVVAAAVLSSGAVAGVGVIERLDYLASYRGAFSLGQEMPIADVELQTKQSGDHAGLQETRVVASSENYDLVESFFPMRYRFRTWASADDGRLVGFENYEQTKRVRHRLYLRDEEGQAFERFDLKQGRGADKVASLEAGVNPVAPPRDEFIDRLGLLQKIRERDLAVGKRFGFPVTRGSESLEYRVEVEVEEDIDIRGISFAAWKVRLEGYEWDENGKQQAAHRPLFIWFSRDERHVPLLVESRNSIGLFKVELNNVAALAVSSGDLISAR